MPEDKVRENRVRRMAKRQGLELRKARRRDPRALDFDMYALINPRDDSIVVGRDLDLRFSWSLDDAEAWLATRRYDEDGEALCTTEDGKHGPIELYVASSDDPDDDSEVCVRCGAYRNEGTGQIFKHADWKIDPRAKDKEGEQRA